MGPPRRQQGKQIRVFPRINPTVNPALPGGAKAPPNQHPLLTYPCTDESHLATGYKRDSLGRNRSPSPPARAAIAQPMRYIYFRRKYVATVRPPKLFSGHPTMTHRTAVINVPWFSVPRGRADPNNKKAVTVVIY